MEDLEYAICEWFVAHFSEYAEALKSQLLGAEVTDREFTNGGGVFVGLKPAARATPLEGLIADGLTAIDGPEIRAPSLEAGALATLFIGQSGLIDHLEIFAYRGDYPIGRHPTGASLHVAIQNVVDLRKPGNAKT